VDVLALILMAAALPLFVFAASGRELPHFTEIVPGPLLRTTDDVADALRDLDGVNAAFADRYAQFADRFCELDDGQASARVVDRLFET